MPVNSASGLDQNADGQLNSQLMNEGEMDENLNDQMHLLNLNQNPNHPSLLQQEEFN